MTSDFARLTHPAAAGLRIRCKVLHGWHGRATGRIGNLPCLTSQTRYTGFNALQITDRTLVRGDQRLLDCLRNRLLAVVERNARLAKSQCNS